MHNNFSSCGRCGLKFPLAQEVSRHVRDKVCKFYKTTSATVTSNAEGSQTALITADSTKHEKVGQGLDLNFTEILSPSTFRIGDDNEFAMMIGDVASVEQVVEICFTCKVCDFR